MKFGTWAGIIALITLLYEGSVYAVNAIHPPCPSGERIELPRSFGSNGGWAYFTNIPELEAISDGETNKLNSPLLVCEGNRLLGPAHSKHVNILKSGRGRYSHWGSSLIFSASDNSDPNTNGRGYLIVLPTGKRPR